jgi:peptidoglycan/xylan/chitin deacetylase (PgdA/CDA1 family)
LSNRYHPLTQLLGGLAALGLVACSRVQAATVAPSATSHPVVVVVASDTALPASATPPLVVVPTAQASVVPVDLEPSQAAATAAPVATQPPPLLRPTPDGVAFTRSIRLPILMYHYVEPWPADADEIRQGLTVTPADFQAQMAYLHDHGYVTVSLYDLMNALALGAPLPANAVVLTFDDGYRTLLDYAVPILQPYGYTGTVFVITQLMDEERPEYLTWPQAEALYAQGWKIEPHTKTHDNLEGRDRDFQLYQMLGSAQTVEAHIGTPPRFLGYPSGHFDDLSIQLVDEMHLWGAVTTIAGRTHTFSERFTLTRLRISGTGVLQDFINGLEGGQ